MERKKRINYKVLDYTFSGIFVVGGIGLAGFGVHEHFKLSDLRNEKQEKLDLAQKTIDEFLEIKPLNKYDESKDNFNTVINVETAEDLFSAYQRRLDRTYDPRISQLWWSRLYDVIFATGMELCGLMFLRSAKKYQPPPIKERDVISPELLEKRKDSLFSRIFRRRKNRQDDLPKWLNDAFNED